jgi:lycopene cyclase domain-containing protein
LPLEELLFFICIPFACLFTYHCFCVLRVGESFQRFDKIISVALIIGLVAVGLFNVSKLYTATTFFSLALVIALLQFLFRVNWLGQFYFSFIVLLIPFFLVNGVLTGTGLPEPVVWYNDNENLGIRMLTIPVEDTFYGMLLQLLNVALFEALRNRYAVEKNSGIPV